MLKFVTQVAEMAERVVQMLVAVAGHPDLVVCRSVDVAGPLDLVVCRFFFHVGLRDLVLSEDAWVVLGLVDGMLTVVLVRLQLVTNLTHGGFRGPVRLVVAVLLSFDLIVDALDYALKFCLKSLVVTIVRA